MTDLTNLTNLTNLTISSSHLSALNLLKNMLSSYVYYEEQFFNFANISDSITYSTTKIKEYLNIIKKYKTTDINHQYLYEIMIIDFSKSEMSRCKQIKDAITITNDQINRTIDKLHSILDDIVNIALVDIDIPLIESRLYNRAKENVEDIKAITRLMINQINDIIKKYTSIKNIINKDLINTLEFSTEKYKYIDNIIEFCAVYSGVSAEINQELYLVESTIQSVHKKYAAMIGLMNISVNYFK